MPGILAVSTAFCITYVEWQESDTALLGLSRLPFGMSVMVAMSPHCTTFIHNVGLEEGALINSTDLVR